MVKGASGQNGSIHLNTAVQRVEMSSFYRQMSTGYHPAAVDLVRSDETLIQRALDLLTRWDTHWSVRSKPLRDEWVRILRERDWVTALGANERGNQLRQASPVSCVLPTERRLGIIRATATHRDQLELLGSENIAKASAIAMRA